MIAEWPTDAWCMHRGDYYHKKPDYDMGPKCHAMLLAVQILFGFVAGLGLLIGYVHSFPLIESGAETETLDVIAMRLLMIADELQVMSSSIVGVENHCAVQN